MLPTTSCPSCWQVKEKPAAYYCNCCDRELNGVREGKPDHLIGPYACDDKHCFICFGDQDLLVEDDSHWLDIDLEDDLP